VFTGGVRRALHALAALAAVAVVAAGCGGSGYTYVSNRREQVFFKVPKDWKVYDTDTLLQSTSQGMTVLDVERLRARTWLRGFDGAPRPDPTHVFAQATDTPRGYAEIRQLTEDERNDLSLKALRSTGFPTEDDGTPIDPVQYVKDNPTGGIALLRYQELSLKHGTHGVRLVAAIDTPDAGTLVIDRTTLVDKATTRRISFTIGCTVRCWNKYAKKINQVADSWTVEETS
jgi:hypothetical protein